MKKIFCLVVFTVCAFRITIAQNVGIGTTAPVEKLHVAGNIKADTLKPNALKITLNAGSNKLLTSDAAGNASWQERSAVATSNGAAGFGSWGDCSTNSISEYDPVTDSNAAPNEFSGNAVAISGNFAIVGTPLGNSQKGKASIYQYNGTNWVLMQNLADPNGATGDVFGISVAISGNIAIVGAQNATTNNLRQGAVFVFQFNGSSWSLIQRLTDPGGSASDGFGSSLAVSGNNIIVGANFDDIGINSNQGSAVIFHFDGTNWAFVQKLTNPIGATDNEFGRSVSISNNFAIVGEPRDHVGSNQQQGSASIYQLSGNNWFLINKITDPVFGEFGNSVSISGNYLAVGSPAAVQPIGTALGVAFIFRFDGSNWVFMQKIFDPTVAFTVRCASNVSISGNLVILGNLASGVNFPGSATIFSLTGLQLNKVQSVTDPQGSPNDRFGNVVSIDGNTRRFLIGAPAYAQSSGKAVFGKIN